MIGNPNSEEARDSYASWQLAIAILREKGVRSGLYAPRADNPDELRWAAEGPRPSEQLDVCAYTPPTDDGDYMSPPMKVVGTLHALPLGSPTLEQRLDAAAGMRVVDPGHVFDLASLDGGSPQRLTFVKREGPGYPSNLGSHPGTNCQAVLRALISRTLYLESQISAPENGQIISHLRFALSAFEERAARRHGRVLQTKRVEIELEPTCSVCGHLECDAPEHFKDTDTTTGKD